MLHELLAGVIGFSQERGDQIIIETLPFENTTSNLEAPPAAPATDAANPRLPRWLAPLVEQPKLLAIAGVAVFVVFLMLAAAAYFLFSKRRKKTATTPAALKGGVAALPGSPAPDSVADALALQQKEDQELLNDLRIPVAASRKAEALIRNIRENASKDSSSLANVVRTWLQEPDGNGA